MEPRPVSAVPGRDRLLWARAAQSRVLWRLSPQRAVLGRKRARPTARRERQTDRAAAVRFPRSDHARCRKARLGNSSIGRSPRSSTAAAARSSVTSPRCACRLGTAKTSNTIRSGATDRPQLPSTPRRHLQRPRRAGSRRQRRCEDGHSPRSRRSRTNSSLAAASSTALCALIRVASSSGVGRGQHARERRAILSESHRTWLRVPSACDEHHPGHPDLARKVPYHAYYNICSASIAIGCACGTDDPALPAGR